MVKQAAASKFRLALVILAVLWLCLPARAAYLRNVPQTLVQPDGAVLECLASGDEFYNWLHDTEGYVIIQDPDTGYYVYAVKVNGDLAPSKYIAGRVDPKLVGLEPGISISPQKIAQRRALVGASSDPRRIVSAPKTGAINNIVVYIRFSDEAEFTDSRSWHESMFNATGYYDNSMRNYFIETSYSQLDVSTTFYPTTAGPTVVSYQDSQPRAYYQPYNGVTNPIGYTGEGYSLDRRNREHALLKNAVLAIASQVPVGLNLDGDNDGLVDNVCFIVKGDPTGWNSLLWPHMWSLSTYLVYINSKRVNTYNFQLQGYLGRRVLCHEMFHTLGSPDLYHYSGGGGSPVGDWDLMESGAGHMCAHMKYRYAGWISSIPTITTTGTYALNPLTSSTNNCYKIASPYSSTEYFVVEYRNQRQGIFENYLPGSGLLVYRINSSLVGNADGPPDEVYVYRPGGSSYPDYAHFSSETGRTAINDTTNPSSFLTNGSVGGLFIYDVGSAGDTISFSVLIGTVATPIFNPDAGPLESPQNVTITCATPGAVIHYTTNGSDPTESDPVVASGSTVLVDGNLILKARAYKSGWTPSTVKSVVYMIVPGVLIGTGTYPWDYPLPTYMHDARTQIIYLAGEIGGAYRLAALSLDVTRVPGQTMNNFTIRMKHTSLSSYTTASWEAIDWTTVYQANQTISATGWNQFTFTTPFDYNGSDNLMVDISYNNSGWSSNGQCRYSTPGGVRTACYSTDSRYGDPLTWSGTSNPTPGSTTQVPNVKLWIESTTAVSMPSFSPGGGTYDAQQNVTIACSTPDAVIHYTTDGVDPTESDPVVTGPVSVDRSTTLKARAWRDGLDPSAVRFGVYVLQVGAISFSIAGGTYYSPQDVLITCATPDAVIHYTTNGVDPTESDPVVTGPVSVDRSMTLKARAWKDLLDPSAVRIGVYVLRVGAISFSPAGGTYDSPQNVGITCATPGAVIHYTTNGMNPTESDPVFTDPVTVDRTMTLKARAYKTDWSMSTTFTAVYTLAPATPTFTPPGGSYSIPQTVTIGCTTSGAAIHYTTNGMDPTESDPVATDPVTVDRDMTLKARAYKTDWTPSNIAAASYYLVIAVSSLKMEANGVSVTAKWAIVSAAFSDFFYIESEDRSSGLRVSKTSHGLSAGMKADVTGTVKTYTTGERYIEATTAAQSPPPNNTGSVETLFLRSSALGGASWYYNPTTGAGQLGVKGNIYLNNISLLVTVTGRVKYVVSSYFVISDGCIQTDPSGYRGVRVMSSGLTPPALNNYVMVTGISSIFKSGTDYYPFLRPRAQADIVVIQ